jgi:DNA-binding response OmpR family regulator
MFKLEATHILVVDDEEPLREVIARFLKRHGYTVSTASTAEEALRAAQEGPVQLIVLDVDLGQANGLELLVAFKTQHPAVPVVLLTGMGYVEELLREAGENGADGYVSKALPLDQLLREIHRVLRFKDR